MISLCTSKARPWPCDQHPFTYSKIYSLLPQLSSVSFLYHCLLFFYGIIPLACALPKLHIHLCLLLHIYSFRIDYAFLLTPLSSHPHHSIEITQVKVTCVLHCPSSTDNLQFSSYTTFQHHWTIILSFLL